MSDQEYPLPPATFEFLILSLKAQTEMHLGMYHFGEEKDRPDPDFRIARRATPAPLWRGSVHICGARGLELQRVAAVIVRPPTGHVLARAILSRSDLYPAPHRSRIPKSADDLHLGNQYRRSISGVVKG